MKQQLTELSKLLVFLGFSNEAAGTMAASFLTPAEGVEPTLDTNAVLAQAQEYAKPHIKPALEAELRSQHKGKYYNDAVQKIIAASGGKLNRADFEHKGGDDDNVQRALDAFKALTPPSKGDDSELAQKYNDAVQKIANMEQEHTSAVEAVRNEYAEKENARQVYDAVLGYVSTLSKDKPLTVDPAHAAKNILRDISENAGLRMTEKGLFVHSKDNKEVQFLDGATPATIDSLVMKTLQQNSWIKESNGSAKIEKLGFTPPDRSQPDLSTDNKSSLRRQVEAVTQKD